MRDGPCDGEMPGCRVETTDDSHSSTEPALEQADCLLDLPAGMLQSAAEWCMALKS